MTRRLSALVGPIAALFLVGAWAVPDAHGAGTFRYTWGDATAFRSNQNFVGPQVYEQTFSVTGLSGTITDFIMGVRVRRTHTVVWEPFFSPGFSPLPHSDCLESGPRFTVSFGASGATTVPVTNLSAITWFRTGNENFAQLRVTGTFDPPLVADPATRYGLFTLTYDLTNAAGPTGIPGTCGGADQPFCFLGFGQVVRPLTPPENLDVSDSPVLSWQNSSGTIDCQMATPAVPSSWGRVKVLYR
jgi:hypothetical protein